MKGKTSGVKRQPKKVDSSGPIKHSDSDPVVDSPLDPFPVQRAASEHVLPVEEIEESKEEGTIEETVPEVYVEEGKDEDNEEGATEMIEDGREDREEEHVFDEPSQEEERIVREFKVFEDFKKEMAENGAIFRQVAFIEEEDLHTCVSQPVQVSIT